MNKQSAIFKYYCFCQSVIIVSILAYVVITSNPAIKYSLVEKQMAQVEERFDEMVKNGQLTEAQKTAIITSSGPISSEQLKAVIEEE